MKHSIIALALTLALVPGCMLQHDELPEDISDDVELGSVTQASLGPACPPVELEACAPWLCGMNSSRLTTEPFGGLALDGGFNANGWAVDGVILNNATGGGTLAELDVAGGGLIARVGAQVYAGADLVGASILVTQRREIPGSGCREFDYEIDITEYMLADDFEPWHAQGTVHAYRFSGRSASESWGTGGDICSNAFDILPEDRAGTMLWDDVADMTLIYHGDVIQSQTASLESAAGIETLNFACPGHALAKATWMGVNPQNTGDYATSRDERQSTLKMIVADYCGIGESFTETGTAVEWEMNYGWINTLPAPPTETEGEPTVSMTREAIWGPDGALCLDTPRWAGSREIVLQACGLTSAELPTCDGFRDDSRSGHWTTWVPES